MRASMTHKFGREYSLGTQHWTESSLEPGRFLGNPSISVAVTQYMVSLSRRKVCYFFYFYFLGEQPLMPIARSELVKL